VANEAAGKARTRRGRPQWVPPNLREVENLAGKGLSLQQIAAALGIAPSTLYKRKKDFSEFSEALEKGAAKGISIVANALWQAAVADRNVTAMIFFLKCRGGWRERDIEGGAHVNVVNVNGVEPSDDELRCEEQEQLIRLLSAQERRIYLAVMDRAARRQRGEPVTESLPVPLLGDDLEPLDADERDALRELLNPNHDENGQGPKKID
jgi:hypothetical protein